MKVCFRPGGTFFCQTPAEKQAAATWCIVDGEVLLDWANFGRFVFTPTEGAGKPMEGYCLHQEESKKWRKTLYHGALTPVEKLLIGDGKGTEWDFEMPDGTVSFEFR